MGNLTFLFTFLFAVTVLPTARCYGQSGLPAVSSCPVETERDASWNLIYANEFNDASLPGDFVTDGFAEMSAENGHLIIKTLKTDAGIESVVWLDKKIEGDVRIRFRIKGSTGSRMIFYFNARGEVFNSARNNARMGHYAGTGKMEMYSVGLLRDDQKLCNARFIGGNTSEAYMKYGRTPLIYDQETVITSFKSPFYGKPNEWFDCEVQVTGTRMQISIDGNKVVDVEDTGHAGGPEYNWQPLTGGGYIAFRNFTPAETHIDYLRVYTK